MKTVPTCFLAVSLLSCVTHAASKVPAPVKPQEPKAVTATRLYVRDNCVLGYKQAARRESLLGIFLPILLDKAYSGIVAAFKKAGEDTVVQKSAVRPMYLYAVKGDALELNAKFHCLILIHGDFIAGTDDEPGSEPTVAEPKQPIRTVPDAIAALHAARIPISNIHVLYEALVDPSTDQTALRYQSRFLIVNQFLGDNGDKARGLVVNINLIGAGAKPDAPVLSSALVNLGEVTPGTILTPDLVAANASQWAGGLGISQESQDAFKQFGKDVKLYMPVTANAAFAETKKGNAIAKFIGDVLDGAKKDVLDLANSKLNPDEKAKAAKTAAEDLEKARSAEESAYKEYLTVLAAATSSPTDLQKFEIGRTLRLWCASYDAATKLGTVKGDRKTADCAR